MGADHVTAAVLLKRVAAEQVDDQVQAARDSDTQRQHQEQPQIPPTGPDEHGSHQKHEVVGYVQLDLLTTVALRGGRTESEQHQRQQQHRHRDGHAEQRSRTDRVLAAEDDQQDCEPDPGGEQERRPTLRQWIGSEHRVEQIGDRREPEWIGDRLPGQAERHDADDERDGDHRSRERGRQQHDAQ